MDPLVKRQALRLFTYGLYAVSCVEGDEVNAFTANWLSQVSFDPPLVAVSVENVTRSLPMILASRKFVVNVMRSGQRDLAAKLGKSALKVPTKMEDIPYELRPDGYAILQDTIAWVACEVRDSLPAGDSTLVVGEVVDVGILQEGQQPLTMNEAGFRHAG